MIVYVIYDPLHEVVREVCSNEAKSDKRCNELDKKWGNDDTYPHTSIALEIDKEYSDYEIGENE